jgi:2-(1,2-epoxy-1,2-dihydrophenyl)acetyl-CoA isomerase
VTYEDLRLEIQNHVAIVTLQRPEKMNAMGPRLVHDLLHALEATARDDAVKAMVITGAGRGFCAGADVSGGRPAQELGRELDEADSYRRHRASPVGHFGVLFEALSNWPKPIIAAVNGAAAGAGMSLALVCDIRIASSEARFISAFVHRAINPDTGSTWYLPQMLGKGRALEMMYTGEPLSAQEAERYGMVNRVVDPEQLLPEALTLAEKIAKGPSIAIELTKRLVNESAPTFKMQVEREAWGLGVSGQSEDREEGIRSFLERRPAEFRGR